MSVAQDMSIAPVVIYDPCEELNGDPSEPLPSYDSLDDADDFPLVNPPEYTRLDMNPGGFRSFRSSDNSSRSSSFPFPPATPSQARPRPRPVTLHIFIDSVSSHTRSLTITQANHGSPLYKTQEESNWLSLDANMEGTPLSFSSTRIGEVRLRNFKFEVKIHGKDYEICPLFQPKYSVFFCSIYGLGILRWLPCGEENKDLACVNENGEWLARIDHESRGTNVAGTFVGTLEIVDHKLLPKQLDELVLTGLAMINRDRRKVSYRRCWPAAASASGIAIA